MAQVIQLASVVICGFLFEQIVKVMGQKELGEIIRILSWVLLFFGLLSMAADVMMWAGEKVRAINEFFQPFRDFVK